MKVDKKIFRDYDIRGIYPSSLNENTIYLISQALVDYTGAKKVAVGRDCRLSSKPLSQALIKGFLDKGVDVYNLGEVSIDGIYFALSYWEFDLAVMVTGSHTPKNVNGLKMTRLGKAKNGKKAVIPIRGVEIGKVIEKTILEKREGEGKEFPLSIWPAYTKHLLSFFHLEKVKPLAFPVDGSNCMAAKVISHLEKKLPFQIENLNFKIDGHFPAHSPNPLEQNSSKGIRGVILKKRYPFGFIFDGDGDRIFLLDEKGDFLSSDITFLLLAKFVLSSFPDSLLIYDLRYSRAVDYFVKQFGGSFLRQRVGYVHIWHKMREKGAVLGGELSGHYSFAKSFYSDSGFIAFLILLQVLSQLKQPLSQIAKRYSLFTKSREINFPVKDKKAFMEKIKRVHFGGRRSYLDGLSVDFPDWWFNVRPSNTEDLVRLVIEAKDKKLLQEKEKFLIEKIKSLL